jgi:hypothetical protein
MLHIFLTTWILILVLFHKISSKIFSLSFLTCMVLLVSSYISYINPRKYYLGKTIIIEGYLKNLIDIFFHILPFIFICYYYGIEPFFNNWKIIPSLLLIILYLLLYNPSKVYHLSINEIIIIYIFSIFIYILISLKFNII